MVRQFKETRDRPSYDLELLKRLVAADAFEYASARNIQTCLDRLGYTREHLQDCIALLERENFEVSGRYQIDGSSPPHFTFWMDVYRCKCSYFPEGASDEEARQDDLYIKLSLTRDCVCVTIQSFHEWDRQL
jgi:hypothetical protein